eukprot:jgi/Psemu1/282508/fgenesh1_pg.8_\
MFLSPMKGRHNHYTHLFRLATTATATKSPPPLPLHRRYHEVSYSRYGADPRDVLVYGTDPRITDRDPPSPAIGDDEEELVRVEMMHAPWNPADVNTVQGRYPSPYPQSSSSPVPWKGLRLASDRCIGRYLDRNPVIGSEGWGRVTDNSSSLTSSALSPGTLVALGLPGLGSLRSSLWVPASAVLPVPDHVWEALGPGGSSLAQLGGTALRLLSDFVVPGPGDVVLQNAGNSGVGFLASQIASSSLFPLNAVGGDSAGLLLRLLEPNAGSILVTYGGMSGDPVELATPQLLFGDLRAVGYWHSRWMVQQHRQQQQQQQQNQHKSSADRDPRAFMIETLSRLVLEDDLRCPPANVVRLSDLREGLHWQVQQQQQQQQQKSERGSADDSRSPVRTKLVWDCSEYPLEWVNDT